MKVLVLGGNGYLGRKVVEMLRHENEVTCSIRDENIRHLFNERGFNTIVSSYSSISDELKNNHYDAVLNSVCNYGRSEFIYGDVIEANIEFPLKILDYAVANGTNRFITIGTGLPDSLNMYSYSKKMFSEFGRFYVSKKNIDFINLKLEMFYGADEPDDRFLPSTIRKMILGKEVNTTFGTQHRDIIYIGDILKAIQMVFDSNLKGYNEIYVGTGIAPTISEIVDYIWNLTGKKSIVNKGAIPMRDEEPDCVADTTILKEIGEWNPVYWKDGLKNMIYAISNEIINQDIL